MKVQYKIRPLKIWFSLLTLLILQWNLACSKKETFVGTPISPQPINNPAPTLPSLFDTTGAPPAELFSPNFVDAPPLTAVAQDIQVNPCVPAPTHWWDFDALSIQPTSCVESDQSQDDAAQMMLLMSLHGYKFMDLCLERLVDMAPAVNATQAQITESYSRAAIAMARCAREVANRIREFGAQRHQHVRWHQDVNQNLSLRDKYWADYIINIGR